MPETLEEIRSELVHGAELMMSPANLRHNRIGGNLCRIIGNYLRGKKCKLFYESYVFFDEKNRFIPDLMVVCDKGKIKETHVEGAPDLVIEILSVRTQKRDLGIKKQVYEKFGVREYWIVDPRSKTIFVYHLSEGRLELDNAYSVAQDWEYELLTEDERKDITLSLKVSLYDDLVIDVREVFED